MNVKVNGVDADGATQSPPLTCGLVMPISAIDGCTADHWLEVKSIISEAIESIQSPRFISQLVSDAQDVGVIQKRIVQGIYNSDIVVCDVSAKNANVMFELGMRLAFDRPVVIVKDDKTDYSFDTGVVEHISYPRDLRFSRIVAFKELLAQKVKATYEASKNDQNHSFLKSFGSFTVAQVPTTEVTPWQAVLDRLDEVQAELWRMRRSGSGLKVRPSSSVVEYLGMTEVVLANEMLATLKAMRFDDPDLLLMPSPSLLQKVLNRSGDNMLPGVNEDVLSRALSLACMNLAAQVAPQAGAGESDAAS